MIKNSDVQLIEPHDQYEGMRDALAYICHRCDVDSIRYINQRDYAHALSEYITSLMRNMDEFRTFINTHCN